MSSEERVVATVSDLVSATRSREVRKITVRGRLIDAPALRLSPGQVLRGEGDGAEIQFAAGGDGLQLTTDNQVHDLHLHATPDRRAIFNDTSVEGLGRLTLAGITATGQVQILARDNVRGGHIEVSGLDIVAADARPQTERPHGYGVSVIQGAFTLWNMQGDEAVVLTAGLSGLSAGRTGAPVLGSGIFVGGAGDNGGRLMVSRLETDAIYSDATIPAGTPDQISGGVFIVSGARVDVVRNRGPIVTYGVNDMVLDNWDFADRWIAEGKITSYGPSGIGFVNFGIINELKVEAPIETFGLGARGFNVYAGTVPLAEFDRIVTHGDGAVGFQISQPIGRLVVHRGIETFGGTGQSLVKGVITSRSAIGLSIRPGGSAREIEIHGGITTHGAGIAPTELHGSVGSLQVSGGLHAAGGGFDEI
jgi:hypothetical protein